MLIGITVFVEQAKHDVSTGFNLADLTDHLSDWIECHLLTLTTPGISHEDHEHDHEDGEQEDWSLMSSTLDPRVRLALGVEALGSVAGEMMVLPTPAGEAERGSALTGVNALT